MKQEKAGILLTYLNIVLNFIVGMFYTPFMISKLGSEEYGIYLQIGAVISYMSIADFGLHSTIVRYIARYRATCEEKEQRLFLCDCIWFYLIISVLLFAVGFVICTNIGGILNSGVSEQLYHKAKIMAMLLTLNVVLSLPLGMFQSILEGYGRFGLVQTTRAISVILKTLVLVGVLILDFGSVGITAVNLVFNILCYLVYGVYCFVFLKVRISFVKFKVKRIKEICNYSIYIFILALVNQYYWKIGQIILGKMHGPDSVAVYGLSVQLLNYTTPLTLAISNVFLPRITKHITIHKNSTQELENLFQSVGKYQCLLLGLVIVGFGGFGKSFIRLWVGEVFEKVYSVLIILLLGVLPQAIMTIGTSILKAQNKHKYQAGIYLLSAVTNIILGTLLSFKLKEIGMAIATFASIACIQSPLMILVFTKISGIHMREYFAYLIPKTMVPLLITAMFVVCLNRCLTIVEWDQLFCCIACTIILFCVLVYHFSLEKNEKEQIAKRVCAIKKK